MARMGEETALPAEKSPEADTATPQGEASVAARIRAGVASRGQSIRRAYTATNAEQTASNLISVYWRFMPLIMLAGLIISISSGRWPPVTASILTGSAIVIALFGGKLRKLAARPELDATRRGGIAAFAVALPMFLFGMGMGDWAYSHGSVRIDILAGFVFVIALTSMTQSHQRFQLLLVHLPAWAGLEVYAHSIPGLVMLAMLTPMAILGDRLQIRHQRAQFRKKQSRYRAQRFAEQILRDFEDTGQGWFWETDSKGKLTYLSASICDMFFKPFSEIAGRHFTTLFDQGENSRDRERSLAFHLTSKSAFTELGVRAALTGEVRWWSISGRPVYDSTGEFVGFRGSGHDLTEKRRSQEEASRLAHYDSLTELANRFQMTKALEGVLNAANEAERDCAVFLLDLDRFKQVNDTMGHPAGDALLQQVSKRLTRVIGDEGLVGRLGGDEFKVVLPGVTDRDHLANLAHRVIESLSQPYSIEGDRVVIGASVGISVAPEDGKTSDALIRNADLALYAAKDGGRGRFHFYANDLHQVAEERREMEQDLRDAIHTGALELHYQPVVDLKTQMITGFEALMRWDHPKYGMQSPARFVEVAEDAGLIASMGEWALRTACAQLAQWPESIRVAVNVSPLQFSQAQLPAIVTSALAQSGIAPHRLELEITESVFLRDDFNTDAVFAALKGIGVRLALDDFGTGYSSLGYLKKAPFDKIKIDQSFVRGATQPGSRNGAIIASITALAKSLNMETTAEGVETQDELELVRSLGCSHVQGYVYNEAIPAEAVSEQLEHGLAIEPKGFHKWRPARQSMLRKVALEHAGEIYTGTIRNMGPGGAMIEGLWNVPPGTTFNIALTEKEIVKASAIWSCEDRMGVKFAETLRIDLDETSSDARGIDIARNGEDGGAAIEDQQRKAG